MLLKKKFVINVFIIYCFLLIPIFQILNNVLEKSDAKSIDLFKEKAPNNRFKKSQVNIFNVRAYLPDIMRSIFIAGILHRVNKHCLNEWKGGFN